jgi:hypothetical protein
VVVTQDVAGAREAASRAFANYAGLPSYRAMLEAEGVRAPGELLLAGSASEIERALERLRSAGVSDFNATIFGYGPDRAASAARTRELLAELAQR